MDIFEEIHSRDKEHTILKEIIRWQNLVDIQNLFVMQMTKSKTYTDIIKHIPLKPWQWKIPHSHTQLNFHVYVIPNISNIMNYNKNNINS